jgi:hypothetical protein
MMGNDPGQFVAIYNGRSIGMATDFNLEEPDFITTYQYTTPTPIFEPVEIECRLSKKGFDMLLKAFKIRAKVFTWPDEWSTRCRSIRSKLRKAWRK